MKREWYQKGDALLRQMRRCTPEEGEVSLWALGQCGFALKSAEVTLYIDPVLTDLKDPQGNTRRCFPPPFAPEAVEADYVLCTHAHRDHLTPETVRGIAEGCEKTKFLVPGGCVENMTAAGVGAERVIPVAEGETITLPGLTVRGISAAHPVHQQDAQGRALALSYQLSMGGLTLLHLGDTYLTEQLLADLRALDAPDVFFPPINGGDFFRTARNCIGNLNPREAAHLAVLLGADMTIPTHFDMMTGNTAEPFEFVRLLLEEKPSARWRVPTLGEEVIVRKRG